MVDGSQIQRPIQVFLNTGQFIELKYRHYSGWNRDFFAGDDAGFERHKSRLKQDIQNITETMNLDGQTANFLAVQMREVALAKSYRPISALFTSSNKFALVGGGKPGEMFFQSTPNGLLRLDERIEHHAEASPRIVFNEKKQQQEQRVSKFRSELGGIDRVRMLTAADKIKFSAQAAIEWFRNPEVIGGYVVELFQPDFTVQGEAVEQQIKKFKARITELKGGLVVTPLSFHTSSKSKTSLMVITIQLLKNTSQKYVTLPPPVERTPRSNIDEPHNTLELNPENQEFSIDQHQELLDLLGTEPLVRSVELPPQINTRPTGDVVVAKTVTIPPPNPDRAYPVVGIVDGGVAEVDAITSWREAVANNIPIDDRDEYHGTFIAGLLAGGRHLNPLIEANIEQHGCRHYDLDILPHRNLVQTYYRTLPEFLDQLDTLVERAKSEFGVRIFNLSLGITNSRSRTDYSPFAARLDEIALEHDVLFVVSAGNLETMNYRPPWPVDGYDAVTMLAARASSGDHITSPAEHLLGLTVGAVNPPGVTGHEAYVPTTYTRRGPGAGHARKPEVCHYGGCAVTSGGNKSGLYSISNDGFVDDGCGTSFAAPLVAATIATINHTLDGNVPRETLLALPIHRAQRTRIMRHSSLKYISKEFVGFGMPPTAEDCLSDDPYSITLVFSDRLQARYELDFLFSWPQSLVTPNGKCRGNADLTLSLTPPIDPKFHSECLRARLETSLYQLETDSKTGEIKSESRLKLEDGELPQNLGFTERFLVNNGLKWTPVKRYHLSMPRGRGTSSEWRLSLKSFTRAGAIFPDDGIAFTLLMTISDPSSTSPIYDEVRNDIFQRGLELADITIAHRLRVEQT